MKQLSENEVRVRDELGKIYPQLQKNEKKVCGGGYFLWGGNLLHHVIEEFFKKNIDYQIKVVNDGKLEHWITKAMAFQLKMGKSTSFHHRYRKADESFRDFHPETVEYDVDDDYEYFANDISDQELCVKNTINKLPPFEKFLVSKRIEQQWSFKEIASVLNIPVHNLSFTLNKVLKQIKNKCKDCQ